MTSPSRDPSRPAGLLEPLFDMLARRWGTALFVAVVVTGAAAVGAFLLPPVFTAEASLLVKPGREFVYQPEVGSADSARSFRLAEMVNSEVEILASRDLAAQVVAEVGAELLFPKLFEQAEDRELAEQRAVLAFRKATNVQAVLESSVIKISFEHPVPALAARSVNLLVERFKDKHLEIYAEERSGFLGERLEEFEGELKQAEQELQVFRQAEGVFDLPEQKRLLLSQLVQLDTLRKGTEHEVAEQEGLLDELGREAELVGDPILAGFEPAEVSDEVRFLREQLADVQGMLRGTEVELIRARAQASPRPPEDEGAVPVQERRALDDALSSLLQLQLREKELLRDYEESSRAVQGLREELRTVQDFLRSLESRDAAELRGEVAWLSSKREALVAESERLQGELREAEASALREGIEARKGEARTQLALSRARAAAIDRQVVDLEQRLEELDGAERHLKQLERGVQLAEDSYRVYVTKVEQARISEDLDRQKRINVKLIESAALPVHSDGLSRNLKLALSLFVGVGAGLASALFVDLVSPRT